MASVKFENVSKSFGKKQVLKSLNFEVEDKEFFCVLGPPSAGKTTLLRLIAGVEKPDSGNILIDGQVVNDIPSRYRDVSMLFETLALFPNKTGYGNIAFPLRIRKIPEDEIQKSVAYVAKLLKIEHLLNREPRTYSGGERQRVALAKTIVRRPKVFLLDEPLSNIDALLRLNMRVELKRLASELGQTIIYSTHDQVEAMSMAQRIAIIDKGVIHQIGTPTELYERPLDRTAALAIGSPPINIIDCQLEERGNRMILKGPFKVDVTGFSSTLKKDSLSKELMIGIRPEHLRISHEPTSKNSIEVMTETTEPVGTKTIVNVRTKEGIALTVIGFPWVEYASGERIWIDFMPENLHIIDKKTDQVLM